MKTVIRASVPTHYQRRSVQSFGIPVTAHGNGSYSAVQKFDTMKEAKEYLKNLAFDYYEGDKREIARNTGKFSLTIDACTAIIYTEKEYQEANF